MKRTISKLLGIAALSVAGITASFIAATPAQAAYAAPFVPATCSEVSIASYPYPFELSTAPTTTGWYVYCGDEALRYAPDAGKNFRDLTNGPTPPPNAQIREKFQANNVILYVFRDVNQAKTMLGSTNVPPAAEANGIVGFTKIVTVPPVAAGNTYIVMMFEQPKNSSGVPTPVPLTPTNLINNFLEILSHESGHVISSLAASAPTPIGSSSGLYHNKIAFDVAAFNAINDCSVSNPMWPTTPTNIRTLVCNGSGGRNATYPKTTWPNLRVLEQKVGAGQGTAWSQYFKTSPTALEYDEMFAQHIAINRVGGNEGPSFASRNAWIRKVYKCSIQYTNSVYLVFTPPAATGPCP